MGRKEFRSLRHLFGFVPFGDHEIYRILAFHGLYFGDYLLLKQRPKIHFVTAYELFYSFLIEDPVLYSNLRLSSIK